MTEADLPAVMEVELRAYPYPWTEGIFRDCLRVGYSCWICVEGDDVLAYAVMSVAIGEAHILNLCVAPAHRRNGLGRGLLRYMLRLAGERGADSVFLEVRTSNRGAIALYEQIGFNEVGRRRGYYPALQGREDALIFAKTL